MTVAALASKQSQQLVDEGEIVYGDGKLDMTAVAGTAQHGRETACRATAGAFSIGYQLYNLWSFLRIVKESTQSCIVQSTSNWVQQRVEGGRVGDALHRERADILGGEEAKLDALDGRRGGQVGVHVGDKCAAQSHLLLYIVRAQRRSASSKMGI